MQIDILRHGEPLGGQRYRGHGVDDPLSDLGWRQMWAAVSDERPWDAVVSSPLLRCLEFAEAIASELKLDVRVDDAFKEVGFGAWERKTVDDIVADDPEALRNFHADPVNARPDGAEPLAAFRARIAEGLESLIFDPPGQHVLLVAHAGVIRSTLSWMMDAPISHMYRAMIPNAAWLKIRTDENRPPMILFDGPTLDEPAAHRLAR